jgi:hypothetical protein
MTGILRVVVHAWYSDALHRRLGTQVTLLAQMVVEWKKER